MILVTKPSQSLRDSLDFHLHADVDIELYLKFISDHETFEERIIQLLGYFNSNNSFGFKEKTYKNDLL